MKRSSHVLFRSLGIAVLLLGCSDEPTRPSLPVVSRPNTTSLIEFRSVLLLHADHPYHNADPAEWFRMKLGETGLLTESQIAIRQMAPGAIPVLDPAQQACVIVWTNDELPNGLTENDMVAYGDALKRYADAGGGVILMEGSFRGEQWARVRMRGGIMEDGYSPVNPVVPNEPSEPHQLNFSGALTNHPILSGVSDFQYGTFGNYFAGATADPDAIVVGRDMRNIPLIALSSSGRVAAINVYPGHVNPLPSFHKSPGVFRAIANTCRTVANRAPDIRLHDVPDALRNLTLELGSVAEPDGDEMYLTWDFGDGTTGVDPAGAVLTLRHAYANYGTYVVRVSARDRWGGNAVATSTVTVTAGKRALLLHGDHPYHGVDPAEWLKQQMVATGVFRSDQITTQAMPTTVPVLDPAQYSCIAVWTNNELPPGLTADHMVAYGDALKRYVDAGGGVVLMQGAFFPDEYDRIRMRGGIMANGYMPLDPVGPPAASETHTLGFSNSSHPILSQVTDFTWGRSGNYFAGAALDPGATLVATDNRNIPAIAVNQSGRVAALNLYPGHVDPVPSFHKSPGVYRAIANACVVTSAGNGTPTTTQPGANVTVEPGLVDATGVVTTPVAITFDNLTSPGATTASVTTTPAAPLTEGFKLSPATFYDISTTATYPLNGTAQIDVCVDYDPTAFHSANDVRLLHGEADPVSHMMHWVDRTTRVDATTHTVCATVSSLSPFAVAQRNRAPTARVTAPVTTIEEGGSVAFDASASSDEDGTVASYAWSFDGGATFTSATASPTISRVFPQDGVQSVMVRVSDDRGATGTSAVQISVANVLPNVIVGGPLDPVALSGGTARATIAVSYTDPGSLDPHTVSVLCGDGRSASGSPLTCTYTEPGVYEAAATVTDDDGQRSAVFDYVVVYDPNGAFVTGGGWIDSPAGACTWTGCALGAAGKASFGFVAKYQKGASTPSGETEFQLKAGNLAFTSASYQWLVVAGARAQFKGEGTINGQGRYGFLLTAIDGQISGGGGADKFRIKVWDKNDADRVVYDNQMGASDESSPNSSLGGGSIVIHTK